MAITQELIASLDDLLQAGAQASASLRSALEQAVQSGPNPSIIQMLTTLGLQQKVISDIRASERTEQTVPQLLSAARAAVDKLSGIAGAIGDSTLANALKMRIQSMSAKMQEAGISTTPWLTILGIGAGAAAVYFLWRHFRKKKALASFEYPDPVDDVGPKVRQMGRSLGAFRGASGCKPQARKGRRLGRLGDAEGKYQFEPESSLEGYRSKHRGGRRIRREK